METTEYTIQTWHLIVLFFAFNIGGLFWSAIIYIGFRYKLKGYFGDSDSD